MARALLLSVVLLGFAGPTVRSRAEIVDDEPARVTTDSPEYCHHLAERLHGDASIVWTADLREMAFRGEDMCHDGHYRLGIRRLRRAWMMAHPDR